LLNLFQDGRDDVRFDSNNDHVGIINNGCIVRLHLDTKVSHGCTAAWRQIKRNNVLGWCYKSLSSRGKRDRKRVASNAGCAHLDHTLNQGLCHLPAANEAYERASQGNVNDSVPFIAPILGLDASREEIKAAILSEVNIAQASTPDSHFALFASLLALTLTMATSRQHVTIGYDNKTAVISLI
jgi:hypothetical protein